MSRAQLEIRAMTTADIALGMHLKEEAGWNQAEADWRRFLRLAPKGGFVGEWDGVPVATAIMFSCGPTAWLAMVLVDAAHRNRGIGTAIVRHALDWSDAAGFRAVRLDASELGRPVYEKLGFDVQYEVLRHVGIGAPATEDNGAEIRPPRDAEELVQLDTAMPGTNREKLLRALDAEFPEAASVVPGAGFALTRAGHHASQVGPVVASTPKAGIALLDRTLAHFTGRKVYVDIPVGNAAALAWAARRGLDPQRSLLRMQRGDSPPDRVEQIYASSGPEKG